MRRFFGVLFFATIFVSMAAPAAAQQGFGIVNIQQILLTCDRGKEIQQELQKEFESDIQNVRSKEEALNGMRKRLTDEANALAPAEQDKLRREFQDAQIELQRLGQDLERNVDARRTELFNPLEISLLDTIEAVRKEKGLAAVFSTQSSGLVAADPSLNITSEVLQRLNTKP